MTQTKQSLLKQMVSEVIIGLNAPGTELLRNATVT